MECKKVAIILAAGLGSRLMPLTQTEHKCMTKVCGTPIIYNTLINLERQHFNEVIIVGGYLREQLKKQIFGFDLPLKITFANNEIYNQTNTTFSLKKGIEKLQEYDELYVIEADVFFDKEVLDRLVFSKCENATILEPYNEKLEGTFVEVDKNNFVTDWRHKSEQYEGYILEDKYKTVNLHKFSKTFVTSDLIPSIDFVLKENGMKKPIEAVMKVIVENHPSLIAAEILNGEKWYEIDDMHDLSVAEEIFKEAGENRSNAKL